MRSPENPENTLKEGAKPGNPFWADCELIQCWDGTQAYQRLITP